MKSISLNILRNFLYSKADNLSKPLYCKIRFHHFHFINLIKFIQILAKEKSRSIITFQPLTPDKVLVYFLHRSLLEVYISFNNIFPSLYIFSSLAFYKQYSNYFCKKYYEKIILNEFIIK